MRMALRTRAAHKVAAVIVSAPLLLAPLAGSSPAAALPTQAAPNTIEALAENKFAPDTLTVPVGTTVTWVNKGGFHTLLGGDGAPDPSSPIGDNQLGEGATVQKTFDKPGTYPFFCTPHQSLAMKGVIIVTAAAGGAATGSGSAGPSASASASGSAGTGSGTASVAAVSAGPSGSVAPDPSLGAAAHQRLKEQLAQESKPLSSFRLALWALTLAILLLGAGVYFATMPRREDA